MKQENLAPEQFNFFRRHKYDEGRDTIPMRMDAQECRKLLFSTHAAPDRLIKKMIEGKRIDTKFGIYWAEPKK